ncbi:aminopeptidase N [Solenopsis invicta]|uniref:aminopeptidase N n=1 Tax=Solenopsis invicta TaxID=13686 RepID=UPI00193D9ECE|nr:aminopeptidase N [Solenopsis invicta]
MDAQTTTFGNKSGCTISWCATFFLGVFFLISLAATGLLVYYFAPCHGQKQVQTCTGLLTEIGNGFPNLIKKNIDVKLPKAVVPDSYELWLIPFIWEGNFTFHGEVKILINVTMDTNNVTLHAVDMKIDENFTNIREQSDNKNDKIKIAIAEQKNDTDKQFYVIRTSDTLREGMQYVVHLKFIGQLNDDLRGFYRSSYMVGNQNRWIAATQFEPTDARRAFPCFDEPALKAKFQITIARHKNMTSISNMPQKGKPIPVSGLDTYVWDRYERSVPMSTYLVAFIVSDFDVRKSEDGKFGVWARHDVIDQSQYSLHIGSQVLRYYEDYFNIKFPLPKMDMVALPDFSAGAMENWGLITYRETAMLYEDRTATNNTKQNIAMVISHELAHQWFGNLVTPRWWTDLWLNEGFASYMEYIGTNAVEPTWKMLEQFVVLEVQHVFGLDSLESSHPISVEVDNPDEINEIFDQISYDKGAAIIRMMDHFLTTEVFKKGLTNYLNEKAYQNAEQNDLWCALTNQAHKDKVLDPNVTVKEIMDTWTLQTGFPVVTVLRNYDDNSFTLTQERFLLNNNDTNITSDKSKELWWIPITYTSEKELNFNDTQPREWMKAERSIMFNDLDVTPSQWVLFNVQETGYYRVNYDTNNWQMIIKQLKNKTKFKYISTINRAQLIDDALNLARAGKLDYNIAFNVTSYLVHETEYLPWTAALLSLSHLDNMLIKTQAYNKFRLFVLKLLDEVYKQVGFTDNVEDSQLIIFTRINVLNWACYFGHQSCVMNAVQYYKYWSTMPDPDIYNPIPPNLKSVVYCTAVRIGGQSVWEFIWQRYLNTNVGSEKDLLLEALACTKEVWLLYRYLDWAFTENSGIRKQDAIQVFELVASNVAGQPIAFDYFRNKWAHIKKYFGMSLQRINAIIKYAGIKINTVYELKDMVEFAKEHLTELGAATRTMLQVIEHAESNIRWLDKYQGKICNWLQKNVVHSDKNSWKMMNIYS